MNNNTKAIELLVECIAEYSKNGFELLKLKALDKTSETTSFVFVYFIVFVFVLLSLLFVSVGAAVWIGEILNKIYYGFFVIAAFYIVIWLILLLFMRKWLKKVICNKIIKQVLK